MVSMSTTPKPLEAVVGGGEEGGGKLNQQLELVAAPALMAVPLAAAEDSRKVRKPYTITKSRESWTEPEHDKFLEALQLFDRDWKKIEAFVGSKTVIQIRSHAQKYFLKVQKNGTGEHLPPPRPKRKAAHPYPQKASKASQAILPHPQPSRPPKDQDGVMSMDTPVVVPNTNSNAAAPSWDNAPVQPLSARYTQGAAATNNCSSSVESQSGTGPTSEAVEQENAPPSLRAMPDFAQVYNFLGSVFDPDTSGHLQRLRTMDPIDVETVLLLMRNLSMNLTSPDFEAHAEGSSAESITALARIDTVKQRMEAAYTTLQDAAGLAQLSQSVEDVFSSGDLPKAAETLATMRHCLSAVGEVAEFANVRKQLEVLEERLDEMVQPRLLDALSNRKVDAVQDLRGILTRIGRFKSLEVQYTKIHVKPLKKLWEDFDLKQRANRIEMEKRGGEIISTSFSSWLPSFYDQTLLYLEQEWKWCSTAFPEEYRSLVPKVLVETMSELNSSFVSRVNVATGDAVPETRSVAKGVLDVLSGDLPKGTKLQNKHLVALIELHNMTGTFARNIQQLFSESDLGVVMNTLKAIYTPYETFKARYGQMERAVLSAAMAGIDIRGAISRGVGAQGIELSETVRRMEESIPQMIVLLEAAVERCISLTGGSEADELVLALDDVMLQYISNLQETLKSLRTVCGLDNITHSDASKKDAGLEKREAPRLVDVSEEEEWSIVQGALQVLTVADCLTSRTSVFEASLRATLARIGTNFSFSGFGSSVDKSPAGTADENSGLPQGGRAALDIATIRLTNLPDKSKKLFAVLEQSKDPRFHALPVTSQRVAAFSDKVNELVYDVLISKVRQRLSEIARLPIWSSVEEQGGLPLPSFSAYPQAYVTSVGEYLLTLPQQLEPLAEGISGSETGNDEAQFFATEWIFKVAEGATAMFMEQLRGIQYITDRGALQLAADIEYLSNVLSALSMPIPPFLSTFHACISAPRDQVRGLIKSDGGSGLDLPTAHLVSKIRRIPLD